MKNDHTFPPPERTADFLNAVYRLVAQIPAGSVATYGQIAMLAGRPRAARLVGRAMRTAHSEQNLPCHRVVNQSGRLAPEPAFGQQGFQRILLEREGISFRENGTIHVKRHIWMPEP